jgi:AraC-like DNA-binding protein
VSISDIEIRVIKPDLHLTDFVDSFWMLCNHSEQSLNVVVLPDGRVDIFFTASSVDRYHVDLLGLESEPKKGVILPRTKIFAIKFTLLGVEYILHTKIASFLNNISQLPYDFWDISADDLNDFDDFCQKVSEKISGLIEENVDKRKRKLFDLVYSSNGSISVQEISETVYWSTRQINRYFDSWFGLSLKAYCNILRFRASFSHIKEGKLYPEQDYTDQTHFIKEIKKFAGVTPKELSKNKDDRFIHFAALPEK